MTRDDIIRMAKEAGGYPAAATDRALLLFSESHLERFAAMVAAAEREACLKEVEASAGAYDCTVACGGPASTFTRQLPRTADHIAKAIRARGQQ